jgi:predicted aspartyl protease
MAQTKCGFNDSATGRGQDFLVRSGPTLFVDVGFDQAYQGPQAGSVPVPAERGVRALVDTGATSSCIDSALATKLNLPVIDRQVISGVGGQHTVNMHLAQIHVPTLNFTIYGSFAGVDLIAGGQEHHALIGRTFLQHFTMIYEGLTGTVTLFN